MTFCQRSLYILLNTRGVTRKGENCCIVVVLVTVMNDTEATGHHTTEMFVPSHHFSRSGSQVWISLLVAGKPIALEEWTNF